MKVARLDNVRANGVDMRFGLRRDFPHVSCLIYRLCNKLLAADGEPASSQPCWKIQFETTSSQVDTADILL